METTTSSPFLPITKSRKSSSRAPSDVRAKVGHTSANKRRIEVFVPQPVLTVLGWRLEGRVTVSVSKDGFLKLSPSHTGLMLYKAYKKSSTAKVTISGDFITPKMCARVRIVPHEVTGDNLILQIPIDWIDEAIAIRDHIRGNKPEPLKEAA